jgi:uncharacterized membrane protein HdeD (DUF308 family)|nr:DUF308 domain-containing protein [uncultured Albidiferax sp.]
MRIHTDYFLTQMGRQWGWVVFRGLVAIIFGGLTLLVSNREFETLAPIWGAYVVADGFLALLTAYQIREKNRPWWSLAVVGLVGMLAGWFIFALPGKAMGLPSLVALWSLAMGAFQIVAAMRMRQSIKGEWSLILSGALAVLCGVLLLIIPSEYTKAVDWLIIGFSMSFGLLIVTFGLRLRAAAYAA